MKIKIICVVICCMLLMTGISVAKTLRISDTINEKIDTSLLKENEKSLDAMYIFNGKTIYVDDDNTMGPWDGTEDYPYRDIHDAISVSSNGDIVYVLNGVYEENVVINKTICLIGQDKYNTHILSDSEGVAISIEADYAEVNGFFISIFH